MEDVVQIESVDIQDVFGPEDGPEPLAHVDEVEEVWLVCGSRSLTTAQQERALALLDALNGEFEGPVSIIEGGARGGDQVGRWFADEHHYRCHTVSADWKQLGRSAGFRRNETMVAMGPDRVFAFVDKPLSESRGTAHTVRLAREAGIPVRVFRAGE